MKEFKQGLHKTSKVGWFLIEIHSQRYCSLPLPESGGLDWHPLTAASRKRDDQISAGMLLQGARMGAVGLSKEGLPNVGSSKVGLSTVGLSKER